MSKKYYIRVYESRDRDGKTDPGTLVVPIDSFLSLYAETTDQATRQLRQQVENGSLPGAGYIRFAPASRFRN
jgi:hypothetical protein